MTTDEKKHDEKKSAAPAATTRAKPRGAPTHLMMIHPRDPDAKNAPVWCTDDQGNGAGTYETEGGNVVHVVFEPDNKNARQGDQLWQNYLVEKDLDGKPKRGRMVSILRC